MFGPTIVVLRPETVFVPRLARKKAYTVGPWLKAQKNHAYYTLRQISTLRITSRNESSNPLFVRVQVGCGAVVPPIRGVRLCADGGGLFEHKRWMGNFCSEVINLKLSRIYFHITMVVVYVYIYLHIHTYIYICHNSLYLYVCIYICIYIYVFLNHQVRCISQWTPTSRSTGWSLGVFHPVMEDPQKPWGFNTKMDGLSGNIPLKWMNY